MDDVGYFYRPRFTPEMTEEEEMGPYYGMGRGDSDILQSYSTQIVPPQDLFGLGEELPSALPERDLIRAGIGGLVGIFGMWLTIDRIERRGLAPKSHFLVKYKIPVSIGTGFALGGFFAGAFYLANKYLFGR